MALSMHEKQHVGREVALRYLRARKKEKGIMLQEFCATTGYSPPYAAFLLRTYAKRVILRTVTLVPTRPSPWPRERKHVYGPAVVEGLIAMYHLSGDLCGKRLQAALPEFLRALERRGTTLPAPLHGALQRMGSATMDRLLRAEKAKANNRRRAPRTKPGSLLRLIPIVSSRELSAAAPGFVEVDLVSHDGGKAAGDHCYTLIDRCSGRTEIVPVPSRAQMYVLDALTLLQYTLHQMDPNTLRSVFMLDNRSFSSAYADRIRTVLPTPSLFLPMGNQESLLQHLDRWIRNQTL